MSGKTKKVYPKHVLKKSINISENLKKTKINNNIEESIKLKNNEDYKINHKLKSKVFFAVIFLYVYLLLGVMIDNRISIGENIDKNIFFYLVLLYYANILIEDYSIKSFNSVILNFLSVIGLYNIILIFNPLEMLELSSSYLFSNVIYFYISFWILSINYNLYEKLVFCTELIFGFLDFFKKYYVILFLITLGLLLIGIYFLPYYKEIKIIDILKQSLFSLYIILMIYLKDVNKYKNHFKYKLVKNILKEIEKYIDSIVIWFLDIFKVEKISHTKMIKDDGIKNIKDLLITIKNISVFLIVKIIPVILIIKYYNTNLYYTLYDEINNEYCVNIEQEIFRDELVDSHIIKLKNDNVLKLILPEQYKTDIGNNKSIEGVNEFKYEEIRCERKMKTLNIDVSKIQY